MAKYLTRDDVMRFAAEAVGEAGADHVSPVYFMHDASTVTDEVDPGRNAGSTCRYVTPSGEAGCIVGRILHKAGVPLSTLSEFEGRSSNRVSRSAEIAEHVEVTVEARIRMDELQSIQDVGVAWGFMLREITSGTRWYEIQGKWYAQSV